jgi:cytochrome c peroxidase
MRQTVLRLVGAITIRGAGLALRADREGKFPASNPLPESAMTEIASVEAEINRIEAETLVTAQRGRLDRSQQILLPGKLLFYDRQLSVRRNEAYAFCHMPEAGFSGPVSSLNRTTGAIQAPCAHASMAAFRKPTLRQFFAGTTLQCTAGRSGWRGFPGYARDGIAAE